MLASCMSRAACLLCLLQATQLLALRQLQQSDLETPDPEDNTVTTMRGCKQYPAPLEEKQLSFILATRNDDYAGPAKLRLAASLNVLFWGLRQYHLEDVSEVIIVDWASPVPLAHSKEIDAILHETWPTCSSGVRSSTDSASSCRRTTVRIFEVSEQVALKAANQSGLSEVHALNAAIRRASGSFLLHIDQDTLVGLPFFKLLASQRALGWPLCYTSWYVGRRETTPDQVDAIFNNSVAFVQNVGESGAPGPNITLHDGRGATGVFAAPKWMLERVKGFDENMTRWGHTHIDLIPRLNLLEPAIHVIPPNETQHPFYHIHHPAQGDQRGENVPPASTPGVLSRNDWRWGLLNEHLLERVWAYNGTDLWDGTLDEPVNIVSQTSTVLAYILICFLAALGGFVVISAAVQQLQKPPPKLRR